MEPIPVKTKVFQPPQDDLFPVLGEVLEGAVQENDIIAVTSKVVAISEGRCIAIDEETGLREYKKKLMQEEADYNLPGENGRRNLTIRAHVILTSAGVDESNGNKHYVLLPEDSIRSASQVRAYVRDKWNIKNLGVIVSDSRSLPLRFGSIGVALGYAGFKPTTLHKGERDLFGKEFKYTNVNNADALAVAAVFVMGETTEQTPVCIVRGAPRIAFTDALNPEELFVPPEEDIYYGMLKDFKKNPNRE